MVPDLDSMSEELPSPRGDQHRLGGSKEEYQEQVYYGGLSERNDYYPYDPSSDQPHNRGEDIL